MDAKTSAAIKAALSEDDAAKVIAAPGAANTAPGVGAVIRNPATGDVAIFVSQYDETYWRVVTVADRTWTEFDNLDGWDVLHTAGPAEDTEADVEGDAE